MAIEPLEAEPAGIAPAAGKLPTRTRRSDEFKVPFSQRNLVDNFPPQQGRRDDLASIANSAVSQLPMEFPFVPNWLKARAAAAAAANQIIEIPAA